MAETTKIAWTDHTFNCWWGCTKVSAGCANCYAERDSKRYGFNIFGPAAERRFFGEKHWSEPLKWNDAAENEGVRRRVFCASMADVFEDNPSLAPWRAKLWLLIESTPRLDWLLLTKRPENMLTMPPERWRKAWPSNAWALTTVENEDNLGRIAALVKVPAKVRGLSVEPMLGPINFCEAPIECEHEEGYAESDTNVWVCAKCEESTGLEKIDWVIFGSESAPGKRAGRPCESAWIRDGLRQCREAGVAAFVKQIPIDGKVSADPSEWPEDLRVREFPNVRS